MTFYINIYTFYINIYNFSSLFLDSLSPVGMGSDGGASVGNVRGSGPVSDNFVNDASGVRPVVSLSTGAAADPSGDGSQSNPYVIS